MKLLARLTLIGCLLLPAIALAQPALPARKVVFAGGRFDESAQRELRAAAPNLDVVFPARDRVLAEIADADGVVGGITREQFRAAKKLRWVQTGSAGVETLLAAIPELVTSEVTVTNMKIVQGPEIADHAFALLLGLTRRIDRAVESRATETWHSLATFGPLFELHRKTAVIVGVGGIGTQIAVRAKAFGMTVIGVDPADLPYAPHLDRSVPPDRLDVVLPEADVVFIAAPHTPATDKMFKAAQFAKMKRGSLFIAVSRGKIFDNDALVAALQSGHLAGAGLDVTDPEPLPKGHALWKLPGVIITPHIAGRSDGDAARYFEIQKENLARFAKGEALRHVVDKQKGY